MDDVHGRSLNQVDLTAVQIDDEFWGPRREANRKSTLWDEREKLESRVDNLRRVAGLEVGGFEGPYHNDPPIYKWIEAACYVLATETDPELRDTVESLIDVIEEAQDDSGYIHAYYQLERPTAERWTNLATGHELFAVGHLIEAALAHDRLDGRSRLLDLARRSADHVCDVFGRGGHTGYPGHPEIELALIRLYRATGTEAYLETATFFIEERGRPDSRFEWELNHVEQVTGGQTPALFRDEVGEYDGSYSQDHAPIREHTRMRGHAVMATFLYTGVTELVRETADRELAAVLQRLWDDMTTAHAYVTGGIGTVPESESFGEPRHLPNEGGYAETCAAFGKIQWDAVMFLLTGEARFVDDLELTLFNAFLTGISLDGTKFSYDNPLSSEGGERHRQQWFETSCCPPNVARLLASLEQFVYATKGDTLFVNLFVGSEVTVGLETGRMRIQQSVDYPWHGSVEVVVERAEPETSTLAIRIPSWAESVTAAYNGRPVDVPSELEQGFLRLERAWSPGDTVSLSFDMPAELLRGHPSVRHTAGRVALRRGPLVYCLEAVDNETPLEGVHCATGTDPTPVHEPDLLEGVTTLDFAGISIDDGEWDTALYRSDTEIEARPVDCRAVPYYAWDNRSPGAMCVWIPASNEAIQERLDDS